jgi:hypothetical protein
MNVGKLRLRGHGRRITSRELYDAALAFLGFFVPALGVLLYSLLGDDFIPSDRLLTASVVASSGVAVLLTINLAPRVLRDLGSKGVATYMRVFVAWVFAPFFVFFLVQAFVTLACAFVLHAASNDGEVNTVARVTHVAHGSRTCRHAAVFEGDRFLLRRRLCGLSIEAQRALEGGGRLELRGTGSPFGLHIQAYRVVTD